MIQGRPIVQGVYVNGYGPYAFLLDTGTTANHMDAKLAKSIGFQPAFRSELFSSAGSIDAPGVAGVEVVLDGVRARNQRFLFTDAKALRQLAPDIQGILGQAFLSRFDYFLDMRGKRIEFGARGAAPAAIRAPLRLPDSMPVVSTSLGDLLLDSGTRWVTVFGVEGRNPGGEMTTLSGALHVGTVARTLTIQGHTFWSGDALAVPHSADSNAEGLLPLSLFKSVYFSNSEGYVSFE